MATNKNGKNGKNGNQPQDQPQPIPQFGIGRENAVSYTHPPVGGKVITVLRYLLPTKDGKYDPENHRLESKLQRLGGKKPTQAVLEELLQGEAEELLPGLRISGGISEPAIILPDGTFKEGNRRLAAFNRLRKGDQAHPADSRFDYIPVEELPQDIDKGDLQILLNIRHVKGVKAWKSRERARAVLLLLKTSKLTQEQVCDLLSWDAAKLQEQIRTAKLYDEYETFTDKHTRKDYGKEPDIDSLWSYFLRVANRPKFLQTIETVDGDKEKLFGFIHNGQIGDHVNIQALSSIWDKADTMKKMEEGSTLKDAYSYQNRRWAEERADNFWPMVKTLTTAVKKLPKKYIRTLNNADQATNLSQLKLLHNAVENVLLQLNKNIPMPKKKPQSDEEVA